MSTTTTINQVGGLYTISPTGQKLCFPLQHTQVAAKIVGNLSRVEVTQSFVNPFAQSLEAVYVFPLPDEAAVDDMEIKIGNLVIKGNIRKRTEAKEIYAQAKQEGKTAGLLEQERDNIFTQSLANIQPGEQIDVTIRYTNSLKFLGGNYEFVFPMVVGPRYIPGTIIDSSGDTDEVPDASRITSPIIPPEVRSGHEINVNVEINAGLPILNITSPSHKLQIGQTGEIIQVSLAIADTVPNKDFILRYQVATQETQATILTQADSRGGHFAIYLIPALTYQPREIVPKDVVFLIDTSASQSDAPIQQCQELMRRFIQGLNPDDTFTIIDFSSTTRQLSSTPLANTPENRDRAIKYINKLQANGGTELLNGIRAVLDFPVISSRLRSVVLLTDGYIGNEKQILAEVQSKLKPGNRLYSFGAGSSVNRFFLNRVAEIGRGISTIIRHDEPVDKAVENFFQQINYPVLTDIQVTWEGEGDPPLIYPTTPPDLFTAQPLVLFGRQISAIAGDLRIQGNVAGGQVYQKTFHVNFADEGNLAIAQLWGRAKIKDLMNQMFACDTQTGVEEITDTALTYQLLSEYTAFVAVSEEIRVNPEGESISVQVPLEMPEGVNRTAVFGEFDQSGTGFQFTRARGSLRSLSPQSASSLGQPQKNRLDIFKEVGQQLGKVFGRGGDVEDDIDVIDVVEPIPSLGLAVNVPRLELVNVTGLSQSETALLTQHLEQLNLQRSLPGEVVFEFTVSQGRVENLVLDEQASILTDIVVIVDQIKRSLLAWVAPATADGQVRIVIHIIV